MKITKKITLSEEEEIIIKHFIYLIDDLCIEMSKCDDCEITDDFRQIYNKECILEINKLVEDLYV